MKHINLLYEFGFCYPAPPDKVYVLVHMGVVVQLHFQLHKPGFLSSTYVYAYVLTHTVLLLYYFITHRYDFDKKKSLKTFARITKARLLSVKEVDRQGYCHYVRTM